MHGERNKKTILQGHPIFVASGTIQVKAVRAGASKNNEVGSQGDVGQVPSGALGLTYMLELAIVFVVYLEEDVVSMKNVANTEEVSYYHWLMEEHKKKLTVRWMTCSSWWRLRC